MQILSSKAVIAPNAKHDPQAHWSRIVRIDGHSGWATLLSNSFGITYPSRSSNCL